MIVLHAAILLFVSPLTPYVTSRLFAWLGLHQFPLKDRAEDYIVGFTVVDYFFGFRPVSIDVALRFLSLLALPSL